MAGVHIHVLRPDTCAIAKHAKGDGDVQNIQCSIKPHRKSIPGMPDTRNTNPLMSRGGLYRSDAGKTPEKHCSKDKTASMVYNTRPKHCWICTDDNYSSDP
jgi:hypothetical protein